jgi:hypothetical protein
VAHHRPVRNSPPPSGLSRNLLYFTFLITQEPVTHDYVDRVFRLCSQEWRPEPDDHEPSGRDDKRYC